MELYVQGDVVPQFFTRWLIQKIMSTNKTLATIITAKIHIGNQPYNQPLTLSTLNQLIAVGDKSGHNQTRLMRVPIVVSMMNAIGSYGNHMAASMVSKHCYIVVQ